MNTMIDNVEPLMSANTLLVTEDEQQSRMGKLLLQSGKLTEIQLEKAIHFQQEKGCKLGEAALQLGFVVQQDIDQIIAKQFEYSVLSPDATRISDQLFMAFNWPHPEQENIKALRSQILVTWLLQGNKSVLISGMDGDQQPAFLSANLAIAFSQSGRRTLLVDANLRDSSLHRDLAMSSENGVADVLAGRIPLLSAVCAVPGLQNFYFLPCGTQVLNPQELLARNAFSHLVQATESHFDVVIFNTPSHAQYADSQIISALVPGVLLMVRQDQSRVQDIRVLLSRFQATQAKILGCVYVDA